MLGAPFGIMPRLSGRMQAARQPSLDVCGCTSTWARYLLTALCMDALRFLLSVAFGVPVAILCDENARVEGSSSLPLPKFNKRTDVEARKERIEEGEKGKEKKKKRKRKEKLHLHDQPFPLRG